MDLIIDIGTIEVEQAQLELWRDGTLGEESTRRFEAELPLFFDAAFREYYENQGNRQPPKSGGGFGFFETLAAIVLYHAIGYLPLTPTHNFEFSPERGEIELRRWGIGSLLMEQVERRLAAGVGFIGLTVIAGNEDALRFYERWGWHRRTSAAWVGRSRAAPTEPTARTHCSRPHLERPRMDREPAPTASRVLRYRRIPGPSAAGPT